MKTKRLSTSCLVVEHLERISRTAIQRFPDIITEYVRGRSGVYALYKDTTLYYVGLAELLPIVKTKKRLE